MRRMIAASVARRIALKKMGAAESALAAPRHVLVGVETTETAKPVHKKRRDGARR